MKYCASVVCTASTTQGDGRAGTCINRQKNQKYMNEREVCLRAANTVQQLEHVTFAVLKAEAESSGLQATISSDLEIAWALNRECLSGKQAHNCIPIYPHIGNSFYTSNLFDQQVPAKEMKAITTDKFLQISKF